jgi:hypothetical protein
VLSTEEPPLAANVRKVSKNNAMTDTISRFMIPPLSMFGLSRCEIILHLHFHTTTLTACFLETSGVVCPHLSTNYPRGHIKTKNLLREGTEPGEGLWKEMENDVQATP